MNPNHTDIEKLWFNARDSVLHALDHFSKLASDEGDRDRWHHQKWIILSVHHAADKFLKMVLKYVDPNDSQCHFKDSKGRQPYLMQTRSALLKYKGSSKLKLSEIKLLDLIGSLNKQRNEIDHREPADNLDPTVAAWSLLAILRAASSRFGVAPREVFDQDPPIQRYIVQAIHWHHLGEYSAFIKAVLAEEHPSSRFFEQCPYCGTEAIYGNQCEACFEEVSEENCSSCGADFLVPSHREVLLEKDFNCPNCGARLGPN